MFVCDMFVNMWWLCTAGKCHCSLNNYILMMTQAYSIYFFCPLSFFFIYIFWFKQCVIVSISIELMSTLLATSLSAHSPHPHLISVAWTRAWPSCLCAPCQLWPSCIMHGPNPSCTGGRKRKRERKVQSGIDLGCYWVLSSHWRA